MRERGGAPPIVLVTSGVIVVVLVVVAAFLVRRDDGDQAPVTSLTPAEAGARAAASTFAEAVTTGEMAEAGTVAPHGEVTGELLTAVEGLGPVELSMAVGEVEVEGDTGRAALTTVWSVEEASWTTSGRLDLRRVDEGRADTWRASWSLAALDARLRPGDRLEATPTEAARGMIVAAGGETLVGSTSVVVVGVEPRRVTDLEALAAELARLLGVDGVQLSLRISAAAEDAFVEVISLRDEVYGPLRDQLQPLPGTVFRRERQALGPSASFAAAVLGQVAPATEEQATASDGRIQVGEPTGVGGIQRAFDARLAGTPGLTVSVIRSASAGGDGTTSTTAAAPEPDVLEEIPAEPGRDVVTTLDIPTQQAAEEAIAGQPGIVSLVAVRASTGEVVADANANDGGFDYGARARVAPGSTFKVVSTLAHLRKGLTPDQIVPCPETIVVGGRSFKNFEDFSLGDVPFSLDFARSCNTAFAGLADQLAPEDLTDAAAAFGIGVEWETGLPTFTGSVPETDGVVDAAAASIGQGRIVVSPLDMVGVASTVASGRWRAPTLVTDPPVEVPAERPLAEGEAETLAGLMRGVVTEGSGIALLEIPGEPVMAKTGTAEYGTEDPPQTHAWIIGFQGDIAFAVFVEGGASGGEVAGPIAAGFLTALAGP